MLAGEALAIGGEWMIGAYPPGVLPDGPVPVGAGIDV